VAEEELEDQVLVHRSLAGDEVAFRRLVERYADRVLRFCEARLGSGEDAADAAQEVFIRVYRSLGSYRLGASFPAWLFAIAANRVRTRWTRAATERKKIERSAAEAEGASSPDPEDEALRSLQGEAVRSAVAALPKEQRDCVELYYFGGLGVAECAEALGLGAEAVKSRLFRARRTLRAALETGQPKPPSEGIL